MSNYLTNENLIAELKKSQEQPTEQLHLMFFELATNIAKRNNFRGYSYKEDMIMEAYIKCVKNYKKFDLSKPNAFSFFTTIIFNEMIDFIKNEHKEYDTKQKLFEEWKEDTSSTNNFVGNS